MTRAFCLALEVVLVVLLASAWAAFIYLFSPGGHCAELGCESAVLWAFALTMFTAVVCWALWPDETNQRHN